MKLDKDFFEPEIIGDIYVSRALKEVWAVNLDLLVVFQNFCKQHKLRFFMGFGTLLGAVRHQGFIPWDDDVDILMPRCDFERLKKLGNEFKTPYFLQSSNSEPSFWYGGMLKFRRSNTTCLERYDYKNRHSNHGIGLEIMALDVAPSLPSEQRKQAGEVGKYQRLLWAVSHDDDLYHYRDNNTEVINKEEWQKIKNEAGGFSKEELENRFLMICQKYAECDTGKIALYLFYNQGDRYRIFNSHWFLETVVMDFAGLRLPAPNGFWSCLKEFYGEGFLGYVAYNKRKPHHPAIWDTRFSFTAWQKRILDLYDSKGRRVALWGTGNMAEKFLESLEGRLNVSICVDNNEETWGGYFMGYPINSPQTLIETPERWHVIIANGYYREIGEQLESLGIDDYYVYVDDWRALFKAPGELYGNRENKKHTIMGLCVKKCEFGYELITTIKNLKSKCEYLIVFCTDKQMAESLQELRSIDRAVHTDLTCDELKVKYYCDMMIEL